MRLRRWFPAILATLAAVTLVACVIRTAGGPPPGEPPPVEGEPGQPGEGEPVSDIGEGGTAVDEPGVIEEIRDDSGAVYRVSNGRRGDPAEIGCADGQREAFVDDGRYPRIAGCLGRWSGTQSMRTPTTGQGCGDDASGCTVPADICAVGWHLCGASGAIAEVKQVSAEECEQAGGGRFSAAISHCESQSGCTYDTRPDGDYACYASGWCSESVCCGNDCGDFGACVDGVWPGKTHIAQGQDQGCGAVSARRAGGVLCCR